MNRAEARNRWGATLVSIGLVGATLEPVVRAPGDDGFPLSTFPMFATPRPPRIAMSYAQGVMRGGQLRTLSSDQLGTGEVMQAFSRIQRAIDAGEREGDALCTAIAARAAADAGLRDVVEIRLVSGTYDAVEALAHGTAGNAAGNEAAGNEVIRARCDVPR